MAGVALTTPFQMIRPDEHQIMPGSVVIKLSEVINEGDLVGIDSNGFAVVATNAAGAIVKCLGAALFGFDNIGITSMVGDGLTIGASQTVIQIARQCIIRNVNSTLVPGLAKGAPVYLGVVDTATVSNYTCTYPGVNTKGVIEVGVVNPDGTSLWIFAPSVTSLVWQTAGNSTISSA